MTFVRPLASSALPPSLSSRGKEILQPPAQGTGLCHPLPPSSPSPSLPPPPPNNNNNTITTHYHHQTRPSSRHPTTQGGRRRCCKVWFFNLPPWWPQDLPGRCLETPPTSWKQKRAGEEASAGVGGLGGQRLQGNRRPLSSCRLGGRRPPVYPRIVPRRCVSGLHRQQRRGCGPRSCQRFEPLRVAKATS